MSDTATQVRKDEVVSPTATNQKDIQNHKTAAKHHEEAAKHHLDAAKHHENGDHAKAAQSTVMAQGHHAIAHEHQKEDVKQHALAPKM
jgi:hypothetical protein